MHALFEVSDTLNMPFECFISRSDKGTFPIRPHWHYFSEMIFVLEGTAQIFDNHISYQVPAGGFIFLHPKTIHSIYGVDDKPIKSAVIKFDINRLSATPSYSPKLTNIIKSGADNQMQIFFPPEFTEGTNCKKLFLDCIEELEKKNYGYDLIIQANLYKIMMIIIRKWQENGFSFEDDIYKKDISYDIDNITEYIDLHINERIEVADIAEICGISYSCFAKKFKRMYGFSCKEYIERFKIFKVEDYLLFTDFDLNYIAQETGYADCSHMIKQFKKYRNMTPKQFRKKGGV